MSGNTQPTQTPADGATVNQQQEQSNQQQVSGVQERINELTAKFHQAQEAAQAQVAMNQQLIEQNTKLQQMLEQKTAQAPALPPLPEGTDPSLVQAIAAHVQTPLLAKIESMERALNQNLGGVAAQQEALAMQHALAGESPAVQQDAMNLYREAKAKGYSGWTPQNLIWMARGRVGAAPPAARANGSAAVTPGGNVPPEPQQQQTPTVQRKTDAELRAMTPAQRDEYWEKLVGNSEIQY